MSHLIFSVDVGNSRIKYGLFDSTPQSDPKKSESTEQSILPKCELNRSVSFDQGIDWSEISGFLKVGSESIASAAIAGSHPEKVDQVVSSWPANDFEKPIIISQSSEIPIETKVEAPEKVGIDRLLNAFAANALREEGQSAIIVDNGTAMTVDLVNAEGLFCGGAILPGFELAARALHEYTALLPYIELEENESPIPFPVGAETRTAIQSGLFWGQVGAARELIERFETGLSAKSNQPPLKLLTGGGAKSISKILKDLRQEPNLALQALVLIATQLAD